MQNIFYLSSNTAEALRFYTVTSRGHSSKNTVKVLHRICGSSQTDSFSITWSRTFSQRFFFFKYIINYNLFFPLFNQEVDNLLEYSLQGIKE